MFHSLKLVTLRYTNFVNTNFANRIQSQARSLYAYRIDLEEDNKDVNNDINKDVNKYVIDETIDEDELWGTIADECDPVEFGMVCDILFDHRADVDRHNRGGKDNLTNNHTDNHTDNQR